MNDTQPMAPTDAEIVALADATRTAEGGANGYILPISFARAVLAKWGTPQPTQAQAGAVPLTDEQIEALPMWKRFVGLWPETRREIVRTIERHHGIKGGQHDAE